MRRSIFLRVLAVAVVISVGFTIIGHFVHPYQHSDLYQALFDAIKLGLFTLALLVLVPRIEEGASEHSSEGSLTPDEYGLTTRELQVLKLVAEGQTSKQIGQMLYISTKTVERHRSQIYRKLGAEDQPPLVAMTLYAVKLGLVEV